MTAASKMIDARIEELGDWRGETLAKVRALIKRTDPEVVETWKWRGVPVWEHDGILCTGETYKAAVKLTFAKGAALDDPKRLFNSSLEGNVRRAIDIHEGDKLDEKALAALIRAAIDAQGHFAGIAEMHNIMVASTEPIAPVRLVGAGTIRDFLAAHNVTPAAASSDAKSAVVRIICVRH